MALEVFKLFGTVMVNNDKANKSISQTGEKAEGLGKKFVAGIGTAAKWGAGVAAAAGTAAIGLAKMAENLSLTQRKSQVIFGDMTGEVQAWSAENERTFGLGAGTIEKYVGGIADVVQGMGMAKDASFDMSKGVVTLGSQLANWGGVGADIAMEDVKKAITGSHEAVDKYGIKLNETVLNEYARKEGLGETFNKLNEAEKAQVRYSAILGSSQNAVDYWNEGNRSSTFYLNEMKEQLSNVGETLGAFLLPLFSKGVKAVADLAAGFAVFVAGIEGGVIKAMEDLADTGEPIEFLYTLFKEVFGVELPKELLWFFEGFILGFQNLWLVLTEAFNTIGVPIFESIKSILTTIIEHSAPIFEGIKTAFIIMSEMIKIAWETIGKPVYEMIAEVVTWVGDIFAQYYPQMVAIFSEFVQLVKNLWESVLKPVFDVIGFFIQNVLKPIWDLVFNEMKDRVALAFDNIISLWNNTLKPILQGIIDFIGGIFSGNWSQVWDGITSILSGIWNSVKAILWTPIEWFLDKVSGVVDAITSPFRSAADAISNIWSSIKSVFKLPHFTMDGSFNPLNWLDEGLPSIGVEWYAKGGVMNQPTIFGMNGANAMVGGEAGPEAVAPIETLMKYIDIAVRNAMALYLPKQSDSDMTVNIYSPDPLTPSEVARQIKNQQQKMALQFA